MFWKPVNILGFNEQHSCPCELNLCAAQDAKQWKRAGYFASVGMKRAFFWKCDIDPASMFI